jgi:hypothetical protein
MQDTVKIKTKIPESWTSKRGGGVFEIFFIKVSQKSREIMRLKSHPVENQTSISRKTSTPWWSHTGKNRSPDAIAINSIAEKKEIVRAGSKAVWKIFFPINN